MQRVVLIPSLETLEISLDGMTVLNAELKSMNNILTQELLFSRLVRTE